MNTLVIDIGNSKIAFALMDSGHAVLEYGRVDRTGPGAVEAAVAWLTDRVGGVDRLAVAGVVPADRAALARAWEGAATGVERVEIDHRTPRDFADTVEHPETVGADRWCNVAWCVADGARDAIVADLGSAHTYDVVRDGIFVGGLIAPGAGISHEALTGRGAQLPEVPLLDPGVRIGRHTVEAIQAGSFQQGGAGIAGTLAMLRDEVPGARILVTGGLAGPFAGFLPADAEVDPHLTLRGAAVLARGI